MILAPGLTQPQTLVEQLRSWILSGTLSPGQRLPVRDVARGLGTSTMPVREALIRLEEAGLVTQEPHKGAVVSELSVEDLNDYYNLRRMVEPPSIQMGVERMTPERFIQLRTTMAALEAAVANDDLVAVLDLGEDLLSLIHGAVANKQLARVIKETWARVRPYKLLFTTTAEHDAGAFIANENEELVSAAEAGDGVLAYELMSTSLAHGQLRLTDFLRSYHAGGGAQPSTVLIARGDSLAAVISKLAESSRASG